MDLKDVCATLQENEGLLGKRSTDTGHLRPRFPKAHLQVRQAELDLPVQTAGPHEGRVQGVRSVGGHQHLDVASWVEAVQLVNELQHGPLDLVVSAGAVVETGTWVRSKVTVSAQRSGNACIDTLKKSRGFVGGVLYITLPTGF